MSHISSYPTACLSTQKCVWSSFVPIYPLMTFHQYTDLTYIVEGLTFSFSIQHHFLSKLHVRQPYIVVCVYCTTSFIEPAHRSEGWVASWLHFGAGLIAFRVHCTAAAVCCSIHSAQYRVLCCVLCAVVCRPDEARPLLSVDTKPTKAGLGASFPGSLLHPDWIGSASTFPFTLPLPRLPYLGGIFHNSVSLIRFLIPSN